MAFDIFTESSHLHKLRVLALSPHTDDYELGAGATIARLIDSGAQVSVVVFSTCNERVRAEWPDDILEHECEAAASVLRVADSGSLTIFKYPVDYFPEHRQPILEYLVKLRDNFRPDFVFCPGTEDVHPDHEVIYNEAVRAFKKTTLLGYQMPWNCVDKIQNDVVIRVNEAQLDRKLAALSAYKSQAHRPYMETELLWAWARVTGCMVDARFAETFECIRWAA